MAVLIKVNGQREVVAPANPAAGFTLNELYDLIGGGCDIIQVVPVGEFGVVCDEEGKLRGQEENPVASAEFGRELLPGDYFAGNVVVLTAEEELQ